MFVLKSPSEHIISWWFTSYCIHIHSVSMLNISGIPYYRRPHRIPMESLTTQQQRLQWNNTIAKTQCEPHQIINVIHDWCVFFSISVVAFGRQSPTMIGRQSLAMWNLRPRFRNFRVSSHFRYRLTAIVVITGSCIHMAGLVLHFLRIFATIKNIPFA